MTRESSRRQAGPGTAGEALMHAKMRLVAARELGQPDALAHVLATFPEHVAELVEFDAALLATSSYEHVTPTLATDRVAERARARALAAVFSAAPPAAAPATAAAPAPVVSLKALRQARGVQLVPLARRLGLGVDVLSSLEAGLIRAATVPERFARALSEALDATVEQVRGALQAQTVAAPALLRSTEGASKHTAEQPGHDFADAVRHSPNMTDAQKQDWLTEQV